MGNERGPSVELWSYAIIPARLALVKTPMLLKPHNVGHNDKGDHWMDKGGDETVR